MTDHETAQVFLGWILCGYVVAAVWYVIARRKR
jgi:hypothetical protein